MPRALLSVSDKTGLLPLARTLAELGWDLIASGGTAAALQQEELPVTPVEIITGVPAMLGGRVKTLHPAIHAGILARDTEEDMADLRRHGYAPISMVVCNLYPFAAAAQRPDITVDEAVEHIDIGGVTLIRAAAKNFQRVTVVTSPDDYERIADLLRETGDIPLEIRRELAVRAFAHTRDYDTAIHAFLQASADLPAAGPEPLPGSLSLALTRVATLRYGENPHQAAAFYASQSGALPLGGELLGGKELSYNNLLDLDAAWRTVEAFGDPAAVIVKHQSPTGIATGAMIAQAFGPALASDPVSAFGGVIAVNRAVDDDFVAALNDLFIEAIAAPDFAPAAVEAFARSRKNCRLLRMLPAARPEAWSLRRIRGGYLAQTIDCGDPQEATWRAVTRRKPSPAEMLTLQFAWRCVQFVPSNAIVLAVPGATVGIGGGLPSRVDAARLAIQKAGARSAGAVLASDAFFPFPDVVELAAQAGVAAVVQPGGSIRDASVIEAADSAGIAMIFTGVRHFLH